MSIERVQQRTEDLSIDIDLLPCPFCGGDNLQTGSGWMGHPEGYVHCRECGGHIGRTRSRKHAAIKAWNTRSEVNNHVD